MVHLAFVKMEGAGNDYVYVDAITSGDSREHLAAFAARVADRHFGVGGDGLIALAPSDRADCAMWMWNADGSRGAMCGNGLRCVAKLAHDLGHVEGPRVRIETDVGVREAELLVDGSEVIGARVDMGPVTVQLAPHTVRVDGRELRYLGADAGNPHAVVFVDEDLESVPVDELGAAMQEVEDFHDGVNVEFVRVLPDDSLAQRTYERGSGETLACGSGAAAAAAVAIASGRVPGPVVTVRLRGGQLRVTDTGSSLVMEGPARTVFRGEIDLPVD